MLLPLGLQIVLVPDIANGDDGGDDACDLVTAPIH